MEIMKKTTNEKQSHIFLNLSEKYPNHKESYLLQSKMLLELNPNDEYDEKSFAEKLQLSGFTFLKPIYKQEIVVKPNVLSFLSKEFLESEDGQIFKKQDLIKQKYNMIKQGLSLDLLPDEEDPPTEEVEEKISEDELHELESMQSIDGLNIHLEELEKMEGK